jgi:anti-sigma B factor antagonist
MPLKIAFDSAGDVLIVRCSGRIVAGVEVDNLQAELAERTKLSKRVVINMGEVNFLDSSGIGTLVRFAGSTKSAHGGMKLCKLSEMTARVLKLTKLDKVLEIYDGEEAALTAFAHKAKSDVGNRDGVKVLCVDSSLNVLAYLRELLGQHGFSAMTTSSAYDARNMLKAVRPSLIILGPNVPGANQDGFQAALKGTPVLNLGAEFHAGEAAAEAETLMNRIKEAMSPNYKSASN